MPTAEIITIGTELLLGETVDTNTRYIARTLRDAGVDLFRASTVGDNHERIALIIREGLERADIIITTGGLGPTVDDPTREAIALALHVETEFRPELWEQIKERFQRYGRTPTENNKRQAYVPRGAIAIENKVGTAPSFVCETDRQVIIALPGVPREMEYLMRRKVMPYLRERFDLRELIKSRLIHTSGVGESTIDARIGDLEELSNPTVGMAAHAGQVDIRITAKATTEKDADALIDKVENQLHERLGHWIYGADEDTLEGVVLDALATKKMKLAVVETNLEGRLLRRLAGKGESFAGGEILSQPPSPEDLVRAAEKTCEAHQADICVGVLLIPGETQQTMHLAVKTPQDVHKTTRTYGGPPQLAPLWTVNLCLDFLRKLV
jgi:competence/damage-inducible protein CinA-like protein